MLQHDFVGQKNFTNLGTRVILNLAKERLMSNFKTQKTPGCYPGAFCC